MKARLDGGIALEVALWATAACAIATAAWGLRWTPAAEARRSDLSTPVALASAPDAAVLGRWRERVIAGDPFRVLRHASPVAFAVAAPEQAMGAMPVMRPPKPVLVLRGVVGGPPWEAVLDGVPGRERGVVVRTGDVLGAGAPPGAMPGSAPAAALRVRQVSATGVVITGMDTTWRLTVGDAATNTRRGP